MSVMVFGKCDYSFGGDKRIDLRYLNTVEHPTRKKPKLLFYKALKRHNIVLLD